MNVKIITGKIKLTHSTKSEKLDIKRFDNKLIMILLLLLSTVVLGSTGNFNIVNKKLLKNALTMKLVQCDTVAEWTNTYNDQTQLNLKDRVLNRLKWEMNSKTAYEFLDKESFIKPDINVEFSFLKIKITDDDRDRKKNNQELDEYDDSFYDGYELSCEIAMIGKSAITGEMIFDAKYSDYTTSLDDNHEIIDMLLDLLEDITENFYDLSNISKPKSYQKYDFNCKMLDSMHYFFLLDSSNKNFNGADANILNYSIQENLDIFKIYSDSTCSIISEENICTDSIQNILADTLRLYLLKKNIKLLLLFNNFISDEYSYQYYKSATNKASRFGLVMHALSTGINQDLPEENNYAKMYSGFGKENITLDLSLIDVVNNKRLIKTKVYPPYICKKALAAIGEFDPKTGEFIQCFEVDLD